MTNRRGFLARALSRALSLALAGVALLVGCAEADEDVMEVLEPAEPVAEQVGGSVAAPASDGWFRPAVDATWQWQLSGDIDTGYDADVYDVDLFDVPPETVAELHAEGRAVICYFSAGSSEDWRDDHVDVPQEVQGEPLDGWEGERWLDIRSGAVLDLMLRRLDLAAEKGCDGVEPDNVQAYGSDTGFDLTTDDQLAYNTALADAAHERGLAIGLKNAAELIPELIDRFDFSVNEECHEYDECEPYRAFVDAGKPVFNAEYADAYVEDESVRAELCDRSAALGLQTLVLPLELDDRFRYACRDEAATTD